MPIIDTTNKSLRELIGVHLWHAEMSSCSQRVRIALAEKSIQYTSNIIDLHAGENASAEYQAIHPLGLVPAIVIDGELIIESIDIIDEVDQRYGQSSLRPQQEKDKVVMLDLMKRADDAQPSLKLLTFEFLFSAAPPVSAEAFTQFQRNHKNAQLTQFFRDFKKGFSHDRVLAAITKCHEDFLLLDQLLSDGRTYLAGEEFTLADVSWSPNFHRFDLFQWPLEQYPALSAWFARLKLRPSYKQGVVDWEPGGFSNLVQPRIRARREAGEGVDSYFPMLNLADTTPRNNIC